MTYNFENILCLKSTLQAVMCDYENNDNTKALQQFFDEAMEITPVPSSTSFARIYEGKDSVLQFIRWFYATIPSAGIDDCTDALYEHLCDRMFSSETTIIDVPTIHSVLDAIDQLFPFFKIVTNNTPLSISIIDAETSDRNGESIAIIDEYGIRGAIFLYRMWDDFDGRFTPATVLLHELGHQLHIQATGKLYNVPESFYIHLDSIGADYTNLCETDLIEVFADTFLLAVVHKTKAFGDPFPEINDATKRTCFQYISNLITCL